MSILVTGGAGYVGSHTVKELQRQGYRVLVYDNLERGHRWAVKNAELIEGDLSDETRLGEVFSRHQVQAVLHFAALAYVGESVEDPGKYYENNVGNSLKLLRVMLAHGVKCFILSSTCAVYGNPNQVPIPEEHPLAPVNPYGHSKLMVERILKDYDGAYGLRHVSLRYFNAAGADPEGTIGEDHTPEAHLIPRLLQAALDKIERIEIFGADYPTQDGTCVRDYIHVSDLADAHVRALRWLLDGGQSETFNLGTGRGYSVREVLAAAEKITQKPIPTVIAQRRPGDPPALVASADKARRSLGWMPKYSDLDEIISTAWSWHRTRG
ncbi:MAG: UDP-glucose 4-epimerase GalE [Candidatus Binatia bacterium]